MRLIFGLIFLLFSIRIQAEDFVRYLEKNKPSIIKIFINEKLHINEKCFNDFNNCKKFLKKNANSQKSSQKIHNLIGNPAGQFCINSKGTPEIFFDAKKNQYDFCNFNESYIIDSWDFYN